MLFKSVLFCSKKPKVHWYAQNKNGKKIMKSKFPIAKPLVLRPPSCSALSTSIWRVIFDAEFDVIIGQFWQILNKFVGLTLQPVKSKLKRRQVLKKYFKAAQQKTELSIFCYISLNQFFDHRRSNWVN